MHLFSRCEVVKNGKRLIFKWLKETSKRMNLEKAGEKRKKIGESKNKGSLITAKYGKGNFVYTGLSFFRELPAGVPGAYRLFVNLISLPQNK
jgi:hypothetical protein